MDEEYISPLIKQAVKDCLSAVSQCVDKAAKPHRGGSDIRCSRQQHGWRCRGPVA